MAARDFFFFKFLERNYFEPLDEPKSVPTVNELLELCSMVVKQLSSEDAVPNVTFPGIVIGDTCGDFVALYTFWKTLQKDPESSFITLGNYIGENSIKCICFLLSLKVAYPKQFIVLRGDLETEPEAKKYGLFEELGKQYGEEHQQTLFNAFLEVFNWLPLAATLEKKILCIQGGISPELKSLDDISKLPRPLHDPTKIELAKDLLTARPDENVTMFSPSPDGDWNLFGVDALTKALESLNINMVIRGCVGDESGAFRFADDKLIAICSNFESMDATSMFIAEPDDFVLRMLHVDDIYDDDEDEEEEDEDESEYEEEDEDEEDVEEELPMAAAA